MKRHYSQVDSVTGLEIVLSECSYNMAVEWLSNEMKQHGHIIWKARIEDGLTAIYTGEFTGNLNRKFFYDEERGYLLGE